MSSILPTIQPRVLAIVSSVYQNGQVVPREMRTKEEVLLFQAELTHIQKQLRALKSEVQAEKKAVRMAYSAQRATISHPFVSLFGGKKNAIHLTAQERELSRQQEHAQTAVYDDGLRVIDSFLRMLDGFKLEVQRQMAQYKAQH